MLLNLQNVDEIVNLILDARLLAAKAAYDKLVSLLASQDDASEVADRVRKRLRECDAVIHQMLDRVDETLKLLQLSTVDDSWTLGMNYLGITTHYKTDEGCLNVRLEGNLDELPLFEQTAILHEVDLFTEWVPLCTSSKLLTKVSISDIILYYRISVSNLIGRDTAMRIYCSDCLQEHGKLALIGASVPCWPPGTGIIHDESSATRCMNCYMFE